MLLLAAAFLVAFVLLLYMVSPLISPKPLALPGAHVVVSGLLLLRRRLPARSAAPNPGAPVRDSGRAADVPFPKWRVTCRRPPRHCLFGGPRGPALRCLWLLPGPESGAARAAPASWVPALQGLGRRSLIPGASLGSGYFCPRVSR